MEHGTAGLKNWTDKPVYIVGGGPSLKPYIQYLTNLHEKGYVIAVNDGFRFCDKPSVIFSIDHTWLEKRLEEIPQMHGPVVVALDQNHPRPYVSNITYLIRTTRMRVTRLSEDPTKIFNGLNSGFCALNYAYLKGAKTVYLLGFDFKEGPNGETHFHKSYPWHSAGNTRRLFPAWAQIMDDVAPQLTKAGVEVWNCSKDSLLTAFPHKPYEEVLP